MDTTEGIIFDLMWRIAKYPEAVKVNIQKGDPIVIEVKVYKYDLPNFKKNQVEIEAVLDHKLGRRIQIDFH